MKEKLISIIIPVYNVASLLPYCLDCIINQTYRNLEIILINDGSTDCSKEICEKYREKDERIILINQENKGLSEARNTGLDYATGEYVSFIDSDDIISLNFYESLLHLIVETNSDIAECSFIKIDEREVFNKNFEFNSIANSKYVIANSIESLNRIHNEDLDVCIKSIVVWNKLYKRFLFDDIRFPAGKRYEDEFTTYKVFYKSNQLVSTDEILYGYVQRKSSIMNQTFSLKRLDALEAYDNYIYFFEKLKDRKLLERCLIRYLRLLVKILNEVNESNYEDKDKIKEILENKFNQIYQSLDELDTIKDDLSKSNKLQSKNYYYNKFKKIL